jgi:hypothetical protein
MSVRAFLTDDRYENGNYHYRGRTAGRYAANIEEPRRNDVVNDLANAIPKIMPTLVANYMLLRTVDKLGDKVADLVVGGEPTYSTGELAKATAGISIPGALLKGFFDAIKKPTPKGVLSAALRAAKS